jgi:hypothetical protein
MLVIAKPRRYLSSQVPDCLSLVIGEPVSFAAQNGCIDAPPRISCADAKDFSMVHIDILASPFTIGLDLELELAVFRSSHAERSIKPVAGFDWLRDDLLEMHSDCSRLGLLHHHECDIAVPPASLAETETAFASDSRTGRMGVA